MHTLLQTYRLVLFQLVMMEMYWHLFAIDKATKQLNAPSEEAVSGPVAVASSKGYLCKGWEYNGGILSYLYISIGVGTWGGGGWGGTGGLCPP